MTKKKATKKKIATKKAAKPKTRKASKAAAPTDERSPAKRMYDARIAAKRCVRCGEQDDATMAGRSMCTSCTESRNRYRQKRNQRIMATYRQAVT